MFLDFSQYQGLTKKCNICAKCVVYGQNLAIRLVVT